MTDDGNTVIRVLVVDDNEAQRLSLTALLLDLGVQSVTAASGRDALRYLMDQEFALILLDVNMPGLDGFETAALIRSRPRTEHTPIIFVTAYHDDTYTARGYSLGAVDYILSPVQPDVLRAKVSVFVELYRKTEQVRQQREALRRYAEQLRQLSTASLALNSAAVTEDVLQTTAANAAAIIGTAQASASAALQDGATVLTVTRLGEKYGNTTSTMSRRAAAVPIALPHPVRLVAAELAAPSPPPPAPLAVDVPLQGWLAAPMTARDGRVIGNVQVSEKTAGEFTAEDEGILVQLAQMAAVAIDNLWAAEARESNRLKDEFLSVLSHELRTPMQALLTWISILRRENLDRATTDRGLDAMERSARAQTKLVEDLLDISRIIRGQLRIEHLPVELGHVITLAIETLKPAATAKSVDIAFAPPTDSHGVTGDAARLQQVVWNLLSNAVKFTPERGRVEVRLITLNDHHELQVQDSGPGIPVTFLPYVFDRFRQADSTSARQHGGLGLGLAIVRHLVELHGGKVRADNAPGGGAVFTVELPRRSDVATKLNAASVGARTMAETEAARTNGVQLNGIRVVLVEDEQEAREGLATALRLYGAEVVAVNSADAALAALQQSPPHVLLSDLGIPGVDGFGLMRAVRALEAPRGTRVPAAALTAYVRPEERTAAMEAGFDTHVQKPIEPLALARVVQRLVGQAKST
jgi:signal transduction histidine kinase